MRTIGTLRPACLDREDRELTLYVPQPHTAAQLAEISENFGRCVEALGSKYEYTGIVVGDTLKRNSSIGLPNCSTLVASLEWRDGGEELPFTYEHVKIIGEQLDVEYPVWGTAYAKVVYDPDTSLQAAIVVTIEGDDNHPNFVMMPNSGRMPFSTVAGTNVELYPGKNGDAAHFVVPEAPRSTRDLDSVYRLTATVADQLDLFLLEEPRLVDPKAPVTH